MALESFAEQMENAVTLSEVFSSLALPYTTTAGEVLSSRCSECYRVKNTLSEVLSSLARHGNDCK